MSESTSPAAPHQPGAYVKDGVTRVATTPARAVALVFDGFVRQADVPAEVETSNTLETETEAPAPVEPRPVAAKKAVPTPPKS